VNTVPALQSFRNQLLRSLVFFMLCAGAQGTAVAQFEGVIESNNVTSDETGEPLRSVMTIWVKKDRARIQTRYDERTPGATMIYRNDRNVLWILNDEEKSYFEIGHDRGKPGVRPRPGKAQGEQMKIRKTGKSKTILGYACEQIIQTGEDQITEIWATTKLADVGSALENVVGEDSDGEGEEVYDELRSLGMFPLSSVTRIEGTVVESQEITKIERTSLSNSLFELPAGYTKQTMDSMIERMQKRKNE
jgi:Domain of unknown function (DUF4412)